MRQELRLYVPADAFHLPNLYEAKGYGHGYLSVYLPEEWLSIALPFFDDGLS